MDQPRTHSQTNPHPKKLYPEKFFFTQKAFFYPKKFQKSFFFLLPCCINLAQPNKFHLEENQFSAQKNSEKVFFFHFGLEGPITHPTQNLAKKPILNNKEDNPNRFILFLTGYSGKQEGLVYLNTYFAINCWILLTLMTF